MLLAAQEAKPAKASSKEEDELLTLMNMEIISVSKVAQRPIDAPGIVSAIPREQIRDNGWLSLNEVMTKLPGFSPSEDFDRRTVSSRGVFEGWNNNHILILMDGLPQNDNIYGSAYTWEITPLFIAKSLEISRGPGSALYGSNAVNGVASINTLKAEDIKGGGEARFRAGERATRTIDFLAGYSDDLFSFVTAYSTLATNGNEYSSYDGSGRTDASGALQAFTTRDHRKNDYFFAKVEGLFSLDGWSLQFHQQRWSFETGHGWFWIIPDVPESMNEQRQIFVLRYAKENDGLTQEYALRYQVHTIDWNNRYYPANSAFVPGMSEVLNSSADELFARAQLTWKFGGSSSVVAGFEGNRFTYTGDHSHFSNVDINFGGSGAATPDGSPVQLRPFLEYTKDEPVLRTAFYAQYASGKVLDNHVSLTLGMRLDKQDSNFNAIDKPLNASGGYQKEKLSYSQTSPRIGLLFHGSENFTIKTLVGRAFRTPAPSETFGANTYALTSDPRNLQPEIVDTVDLAADWIIKKGLNWRINFFNNKLKNLIGYLASANKSANLYTLTTRGMESELLWTTGAWSGFANVSFAKRVDEVILDPTIAVSKDVTWVPSKTANAGVTFKSKTWNAALSGHYQGETLRRTSDVSIYRSANVDAWTSLDLRVGYKFNPKVEVEMGATNATDKKGFLAKNFQFPFDYHIEPRTVWVGLRIN